MPFDFNNVRPPETYVTPHGRRRRYWPYPNSIENLAFTPDEIRSWRSTGSVTLPEIANAQKSKKCNGECVDKPMPRYYPENYLHEQAALENPMILAALKNTPIIRRVPTAPLELIQPRFVHKSKRSQFHLVVPQAYRAALCKITDNLNNEQQTQRHALMSRKGKEFEVKDDSKALTSKTEASGRLKDRHTLNENSLTFIAKGEGLLKYIRTKVERDVEVQQKTKLDKQFFSSDVEFSKSTRTKSPLNETLYNWDKQGGMQAMCVDYPGISVFHESPSEVPVTLKASEEIIENAVLSSNKKVINKIPNDMLKLFLNAPSNNFISSATHPDQFKGFSHYGLLETAKADALESCLKKLYRREREVKLPNQLIGNVYGPLKGMPKGYKFQQPHLPEHLKNDCPPQPDELEKVERVIKNEKKARRSRKARGVESVETVSRVVGQFAKPTIESSENESLAALRKSVMTLDDYPTKYNELTKRDSSDSLFCRMGAVKMEQENNEGSHPSKTRRRKKTWMVDIMAKSSAALAMHKALWQDQLNPDKIKLRVETTADDMSSTSMESFEEHEGEEEYMSLDRQKEQLMGVKDSTEDLPYPDVTFSSIRVPTDVQGIGNNWLYRKLAEDQRSLSSSDSNEALDDDQHDDEEEDEEEEEDDEEEAVDDGNNKLYAIKDDISDASIALDKIFKDIQPLLTRSTRLQVTGTASQRLAIVNKKSSNAN